ncbi:MAG: hypothetical protein ABH807_00070 [Candidatus Shapirobacteria bacterium]
MIVLIAQKPNPLGQIGGALGLGPWGDIVNQVGPKNVVPASAKFAGILSNLLGVMTIVAGLWFMINFLSGGYAYLSAAGSSEKMKEATQRIGNSLVGLIVVIAAYAVISLIGGILGFSILDIETNIGKITP